MRRLLTAAVALFLAVAMAPTASAAKEPSCWSASEKNAGYDRDNLLWTYSHTVNWCGDGDNVVSVDPPIVEFIPRDENCTWVGVTDAWADPPGHPTAETFSVGHVVCTDADAIKHGMNPWIIVTVFADGRYSTDMGIA